MQRRTHPETAPSRIASAQRNDVPTKALKRSVGQEAIDPRALRGIRDFLDRMPTERLPEISRIILFGSHARGDFEEESDVDLAIALHGMPTKAGQRSHLVLEMSESRDQTLLATLTDITPMIVWEGELSNPNNANNPQFHKSILNEGIEIPWMGEHVS